LDINIESGNPSKNKSNRVLKQATKLKTNIHRVENEVLERNNFWSRTLFGDKSARERGTIF